MNLQAARKASGKTQAQVAKDAGITERHYQHYEYGKRKPGAEIAINVAVALGITDFGEFKKVFGATTPDNANEPDGNQAQSDVK
jgi:transcriptional regulator with XRE-family HTH domain